MSVSIDQFWELARASALLDANACEALQDRFAALQGAESGSDARALVAWLIPEKVMTSYQAQVLLSGKPGPFFFGDYRVNDRVESALGVRRFTGVHLPTNHQVLLHFWRDPTDRWSEVQSQAARHQTLDHPHLDRCYETIQAGLFRIGVTEDIEGISLRSLLARHQNRPTGDAIRITYQIAQALNQIHTASLIHGYLTPDEIILQPGNHPRLRRLPLRMNDPIDFTAADPKNRLLDQADYLAPELQRSGQPSTAVSDIYALGCVFYHLLSGQPPFPDGNLADKMHRHATEPIRPLEEFRALPSGLGEIASFMMAKKPEVRYQQGAEVARKLEAFLGGAPKARLPRPRTTEAYYLSHLQKQRERIPTHLLEPKANPTSTIAATAPPPTSEETANIPDAATTPLQTPIVTTDSSATRERRTGARNRPAWHRWSMATATILSLLVAISLVIQGSRGPQTKNPAGKTPIQKTAQHNSPPKNEPPTPSAVAASDGLLIDDDGRTLWQSPTKGDPIELDFAPPSSQFFLISRPRAILESNEGPLVLQALGPLNDQLHELVQRLQLPLEEVDHLLVALTPEDVGPPRVTLVAQIDSASSVTTLLDRVAYKDSPVGKRWEDGDFHAVVPQDDPRYVCFGSELDINEILAAGGAPPLLKRQIERLRRLTDRDRHMTLLFDPHFLKADGRETLRGVYAMLRTPIFDFLGDKVQAASLSLNFENPFYGEIRLASSLDQDPFRLAAACRERLSKLSKELNDYLGKTTIERFWQPIAMRFPLMISFLNEQTRIGVTDRCAVINFVMPEKAAHNLVLASQLAIEASDQAAAVSAPDATAPRTDWPSILGHPMDLSFPQLSLEFAMRDFASSVNDEFPGENIQVKILGGDLQLAGITRNQQIRNVNLRQQRMDEILDQLVRQANPVRAESLSSPEQKLVWVLAPASESTGRTILITTRTAATRKGYSLPKQFLDNSPQQ